MRGLCIVYLWVLQYSTGLWKWQHCIVGFALAIYSLAKSLWCRSVLGCVYSGFSTGPWGSLLEKDPHGGYVVTI